MIIEVAEDAKNIGVICMRLKDWPNKMLLTYQEPTETYQLEECANAQPIEA